MTNLLFNSVLINRIIKLKQSTIINLIGLSLGFAVLFYIIFFIREELSYNQFHNKINTIYCIFTNDHTSKNELGGNSTVPALPEALRNEYPEVKDAALVYNSETTMLMSYKTEKNYERVQLADPNLFNILSFQIIRGSLPSGSEQINIMAISRKMATKYFGSQNPLGQEIKINNKDQFTVIAVFEDIPDNSSTRFDFWMPIKLLEKYKSDDHLSTWYNLSFTGYVLLNENASLVKVNKKLEGRIQQSNPGYTAKAQLYPFKKLYLDEYGHKKQIHMMILIAFVILALVSINFINLQVAETFKRIKEYGIKKINGAKNSAIYKELIGEVILFVCIAIIVSLFITQFGSHYMIDLMGKSSSTNPVISVYSVSIVVTVALVIAFLSGLIPGLTMQSISAQNSLKEKVSEKISIKKLRYVFTSFQFCMAIVLIICLFITNKQVSYLCNKDLGFNKDQLLFIDLNGNLKEKYDLLKGELDKNPSILSSSLASRSPIGIYWNGGGWSWKGKPVDFDPEITFIETDNDFQKTFGIKMKEGNYFKDNKSGVIINKTFAQMMSPKGNALNEVLSNKDNKIQVPVIGIIDDFNFKPLNRDIGPLMLIPKLGYDEMRYLFVRISPNNISSTLQLIERTVVMINPEFPYQHHFLDEDFSRLYDREKRLRNQMMFFSIMAILISAIGLWGILLFIVKQRTKEIGIRKVNGARVTEILAMLNTDFIIWVAVAFVIACPIAWYAMHQWLQNFAYKTELSWWVFALAGIVAVTVAVLTISWQSYKAATRNPVQSLRYE